MTNNNFQAVWLSKYRDVLQGKIVEYENLIHSYAAIEEIGEDLSTSDLYQASSGWLGTRGDDDTKEKLHSIILQNKQWLTTICESLVKLSQEEIKELSEVLGKVTVEEITARNQVRKILSNYQSKRRQDEKQLNRILENIIKLGEEEYGILQKSMQVSANEFIKFFAALLKSLEDETTTKGSLFINYYDTIVNLDKYHSELENLSLSDFDNFLAKFNRPGDDSQLAKCFVENFRGNKDLINEVSQWADKTNLKSSGTDKGYTSLEEEDQKRLDKVMQNHLELLFKKCVKTRSGRGRNRFEDIQKQIKKIVKAPEDMKEIGKNLKEQLDKLTERIQKSNSDFTEAINKSLAGDVSKLKVKVRGMGDALEIGFFDDKDYLKNEDNKELIERVTKYLFTINVDDDALESFEDLQYSFGVLIEGGSGSRNSSKSKFRGDKIDEKDIEDAFNEIMESLISQIELVKSIVSKDENYDKDKLKDSIRLGLNDSFSSISSYLHNLGANLTIIRKKTSWSESIFQTIEKKIESILELLDKDLSTKANIENVLGEIADLIRKLGS